MIAAFDLSVVGTGYCNGDKIGVWRPNKLKGIERMDYILDAIKEITYPDDIVVFLEGFSFNSKGKAVYEIAGLGYLVRYHLWMQDIPTYLVPPASIKKYATGKGHAKKPDMLAAAIRRFDYDGPTDDNAVDAFLLWHLANEYLGHPVVGVPAAQAKCVGKVERMEFRK